MSEAPRSLVLSKSSGRRSRNRWRRPDVLASALVVVSLIIVVVVASLWQRGETRLTGTDLGAQAAPGFKLTDHRGETVRLSDLRGRAVALTFIFTSCPDVCPLIAEKLRWTYESLPEDQRDEIALVAITVDPENDTPEAMAAFSATHRLADNPSWYALTGDRAMLQQVWQAYGIWPGAAAAPEGSMGMGHTDAVYVIDAEGRERVFMRSDFNADALAANLTALVNEA
ncbi:MAG TPA: SCO family protein [Thermomicrobiales bacterium]|nr:SCO family protein [Thermomicrobiales bacterium]